MIFVIKTKTIYNWILGTQQNQEVTGYATSKGMPAI